MKMLRKLLKTIGLGERGLREEFDRTITKQLRRLGRPSKRKIASAEKKGRKTFERILDSDPEFYILYRSATISATWLSAVAVATVHDLGHSENSGEPPPEQVAALAFFSRLANDLWAIIELVERGYDIQARALTRSYLEHVDVLICCIHDKQLTEEFVNAIEPEQANHFWHKYVSKNKIKKKVSELIATRIGLPESDVVDVLRESAELAGSTILHPSMMAGLITALGDANVDYEDTYPIFPRPTEASAGIFRVILTHLFWLFLAMGPLPKFPSGEWGALFRHDDLMGSEMLDKLKQVNTEMLGFLLNKQIMITARDD